MCVSYYVYKHSMDLLNLPCETKILSFIFRDPKDVIGITWIYLKAKLKFGLKFIEVNNISRML